MVRWYPNEDRPEHCLHVLNLYTKETARWRQLRLYGKLLALLRVWYNLPETGEFWEQAYSYINLLSYSWTFSSNSSIWLFFYLPSNMHVHIYTYIRVSILYRRQTMFDIFKYCLDIIKLMLCNLSYDVIIFIWGARTVITCTLFK